MVPGLPPGLISYTQTGWRSVRCARTVGTDGNEAFRASKAVYGDGVGEPGSDPVGASHAPKPDCWSVRPAFSSRPVFGSVTKSPITQNAVNWLLSVEPSH